MLSLYKKRLHGNIWKYAIHLVTVKRIFYSITGVYLLTTAGATPQTVGMVIAIGGITTVLLELPSGYISDKLGHKNALVVSRLFYLLGGASYIIGGHVAAFIIAEICLGVAESLKSGTGDAFMHDTLRGLRRDREYAKIMGKLGSFGHAISIAFIVAVPFLTSISFRFPFMVMFALDLVGLAAVMLLQSPRKTTAEIEELGTHNMRHVLHIGIKKNVLRYLVLSGFLIGAVLSISMFKDVYQQHVGLPVIYFGVFWGLSRVVVSALLPLNGWIRERFTFHQFLAMKIGAILFLFSGLILTQHPIAVVVLLIGTSAVNWSIAAAEKQYLLEKMGNTSFKATLLSVRGLLNQLFGAVGVFVLGQLVGTGEYQRGFATIMLVFVIVVAPLFGWILYASKKESR